MLNGISSYFPLISKASTITARITAVCLTAFGLKKLWSPAAKEKHTFTARVAFSSIYVLHMTATAIATAAFFDAAPISPAFAAALISTTSLMINSSNFIETYLSQTWLKAKHSRLKDQLQNSNLDLQRSQILIEGIRDFDTQISLMNEELQALETLKQRLKNADTLAGEEKINELIEIYMILEEKYQEKYQQNKIISAYFKSIPPNYDIEYALTDIRNQISQAQNAITETQSAISKYSASKTKARMQRNLFEHEQTLKRLGIINVQCIRYKKIEDAIKQLRLQLTHKENPSERKFFQERIHQLKSVLVKFSHCEEEEQTFNFEFGITTTLKDLIQEESEAFKTKLNISLGNQCHLLATKIKEQKLSVERIQSCFNFFVKNPGYDVKNHYTHIRKVSHALAELNKTLSLETLNRQGNKSKVNFSSVTSLLALLLCVIPQEETTTFIKPLMIGVGLLSSTSSLWGFYQRNLFIKKTEIQAQSQRQRVEKEIAFKQTTLAHLLSKPSMVKSRPQRAAKTKALAALTPLYRTRLKATKTSESLKISRLLDIEPRVGLRKR